MKKKNETMLQTFESFFDLYFSSLILGSCEQLAITLQSTFYIADGAKNTSKPLIRSRTIT